MALQQLRITGESLRITGGPGSPVQFAPPPPPVDVLLANEAGEPILTDRDEDIIVEPGHGR